MLLLLCSIATVVRSPSVHQRHGFCYVYGYFCGVGVEDAQVEELFSLDDTLLDDLKLAMLHVCMCMCVCVLFE